MKAPILLQIRATLFLLFYHARSDKAVFGVLQYCANQAEQLA